MILAVILAAGRSERMGRPKAFLPFGSSGETFIDQLFKALSVAGIVSVYVVGRPDDAELARTAVSRGARFVANLRAEEGQISSIQAALDAADTGELEGILVAPVDVPCITSEVVTALLAASASSDAAVIRPTHLGRHGHPVIFKRAVFDELRSDRSGQGARGVVRSDPARVLDVEVAEPGVAIDIDTPDEYWKVFGRRL